MENQVKKSNRIRRFLKKHLKIMMVGGFIIVACIGAISIKSFMDNDNKTTKIGFENIGELATQSAICTEVHVTSDWRKMFGKLKIPFTQSKYIYSHDYEVKAGFNFKKIEWKENEGAKIITVKLPKVKVLSNTPVRDSFKIYHETESKFNRVTLSDNMDALEGMQKQAERDAVANGLLKKARTNAKTVLIAFFKNKDDYKEYQIKFVDQK